MGRNVQKARPLELASLVVTMQTPACRWNRSADATKAARGVNGGDRGGRCAAALQLGETGPLPSLTATCGSNGPLCALSGVLPAAFFGEWTPLPGRCADELRTTGPPGVGREGASAWEASAAGDTGVSLFDGLKERDDDRLEIYGWDEGSKPESLNCSFGYTWRGLRGREGWSFSAGADDPRGPRSSTERLCGAGLPVMPLTKEEGGRCCFAAGLTLSCPSAFEGGQRELEGKNTAW